MGVADFKKVAVIGAGQMGSGIAQVCASHRMSVVMIDSNLSALKNAEKSIDKSLSKLVEKNKISPELKYAAQNALEYQTNWQGLQECDIFIEAVVEDEKVKGDIFTKLEEHAAPHAIFASNTSSISITKLASYTKRPEQFIGMHFMNPVPLMKLVEIISGLATSTPTLNRVTALAQGLGKETIIAQDFPGFVINRILMPMINEAFQVLMENIASPEDIDNGMKLGTNQPMGPLTLADFIGLDTCLSIMQVLHKGLGDDKYRPSPMLVKYVEAGYLGRKKGRGVYKYDL